MAKQKRNFKIDVFAVISLVVIGIYCLSLLVLIGWGFLNSVKAQIDFRTNALGFPSLAGPENAYQAGWHFDNYISAFNVLKVERNGNTYYLEGLLFNSLLYAVAMAFTNVAMHLVVAYACAKYTFKLNKILYMTAIVVMLVPIVGSLPSEMRMAQLLFGKENNLLEVCLMKNRYTGTYFLVFYATYKSISWTYAEAAQLDGAGHFQIFMQIMIPLAKNTIMAVFILLFINYWNDYYIPMMFWSHHPTVSYALYLAQNSSGSSEFASSVPKQLAACFIVSIPVFTVFMIFRNQIIGNVTMGGLKG